MTATSRPDAASPIANLEQAAAWNGPEGVNWAEAADAGGTEDVLIEPLLDAAAVAGDDRVLDIGCGTGGLTRRAAQQARRGGAVGIDLSSNMVEVARAMAEWHSLDNARFEVGDAQVHPFAPASFDLVVSHFGIMFFDDPAAAFANIGRALRPGGRLTFVCPQTMERCEWYTAPLTALLGDRPTAESSPSRMFSLATAEVIDEVLGGAGFTGLRIEPLAASLHMGPDLATTVRFYAGSGPVRAVVDHDPALTDGRVQELLTAALRPHVGPSGVRIPGAHWLVTAHRGLDPST